MHEVIRNSHGNVNKDDVARMNVRWKQWLRMSKQRQNKRINRYNLIEYINSI